MNARRIATCLAALLLWCPSAIWALSATPTSIDSCLTAIPSDLSPALRADFPSLRLPRESDSPLEDRQYGMDHGGSRCLLVARGDFDGDRSEDLALLLVPIDSASSGPSVLVAARHRGSAWRVDSLYTFDSPGSTFVARLSPGAYRMSEAARETEDRLESGEVESFTSTHDGIDAGKPEAFDIGFFYSRNSWVHVRLSD